MNLKQAHPDEPWLWRPQWAAGEIHSSAKPGAIAVCAIALFWNAIALPSAVPTVLAHNLRQEPKFAWFALFPIVGFGLIAWAIHLLLRWNAYGDSRFEMKSVPGKIGGTLDGSIHVARGVEPMRRVTLKLVCINHSSSGNSSSERPSWSDESEVAAGGDGSIPVAFLIPPECRPTDDTNFRDRIYWQLNALSPGGIVNYKSSFEVPVFQIGETSAQAAEVVDLRTRRDQRVSEFRPQGSAIRFGPTADGHTEIYFRPFRNPSVILGLLGFLAIWSGIYLCDLQGTCAADLQNRVARFRSDPRSLGRLDDVRQHDCADRRRRVESDVALLRYSGIDAASSVQRGARRPLDRGHDRRNDGLSPNPGALRTARGN